MLCRAEFSISMLPSLAVARQIFSKIVAAGESSSVNTRADWFYCFYLANRFHVAVRLFSNRSQMTSKCGKNKEVAHGGAPVSIQNEAISLVAMRSKDL